MGDTSMVELLKMGGSTGFALVVLIGVYRTANRVLSGVALWAPQFLEVQTRQAEAMGALSTNVGEAVSGNRETLTVMRAIGSKVDTLTSDVGELRTDVKRYHEQGVSSA